MGEKGQGKKKKINKKKYTACTISSLQLPEKKGLQGCKILTMLEFNVNIT